MKYPFNYPPPQKKNKQTNKQTNKQKQENKNMNKTLSTIYSDGFLCKQYNRMLLRIIMIEKYFMYGGIFVTHYHLKR